MHNLIITYDGQDTIIGEFVEPFDLDEVELVEGYSLRFEEVI